MSAQLRRTWFSLRPSMTNGHKYREIFLHARESKSYIRVTLPQISINNYVLKMKTRYGCMKK